MGEFFGGVWDFFWSLFWIFAIIAYLITLVNVVFDLFRDRSLGGGWKALWLIFLWFVPFLTLLVYILTRGSGMAERSLGASQKADQQTVDYIRRAAGTSPADEIAKAKALFADGTITQGEFDALKAKALA